MRQQVLAGRADAGSTRAPRAEIIGFLRRLSALHAKKNGDNDVRCKPAPNVYYLFEAQANETNQERREPGSPEGDQQSAPRSRPRNEMARARIYYSGLADTDMCTGASGNGVCKHEALIGFASFDAASDTDRTSLMTPCKQR